jgi:acetyltransferase-like isoleucine patch superfamily enzyme
MHGEQLMASGTVESRELVARIKVATRLSSRLSTYSMEDSGPVREVFGELTGKPVDDSFILIPPFFADYGLNITIGHNVFIHQGCMFTGHGAIDIGDDVMIGPKVNLVTAGHPLEPERRRRFITVAPVTVGRNVWIGAAVTVLPGVEIGADAAVAAGAVVTRDVPPATLVAGVPARVIKHL